MLLSLDIKNIALIDSLNLTLSEGLNILSGETGAGKSIIIDSLNFVLGGRADKGLIRHGENFAYVQAVFSSDYGAEVEALLVDSGIFTDRTENLIVSRMMSETRSEARINNILVSLAVLKKIVGLLVDVHSQHENQALLNEANHIKILDNNSKTLPNLKKTFADALISYKNIESELKSFPKQAERERQIDLLSFQIEEIEKANVKEGEEEALIKDRAKLNNSQRIAAALSHAKDLTDGDGGAISALYGAIKDLNQISQYIDALTDIITRLDAAKIELRDISVTLGDEISASEYDDNALKAIESRIEVIRKIKKRFGQTLEEITEYYDKAKKEYNKLITAEEKIEELTIALDRERKELLKLAKKIHAERAALCSGFENSITQNLVELGMPSSRFEVELNFPETDGEILSSAAPAGADTVRFLISPNKGEPLKPLSKIASGGEMSRFMLGLKNITAELEGIDTLVFDEIDTGISGKIAKVVAKKLYNIAKDRQVIAVTHLPQLASMADTHYLIVKRESADKTRTFVERLTSDASISEVMRLSGAREDSAAGKESALELIKESNNYKIEVKN